MDTSDLILFPSPFSTTANPRFFYTNPYHKEGYGKLLAALRQRKGLILLTGEPGTGKTTFLRKLSLTLDETAHVTFLPCAAPTFQEILSHLCEQCGLSLINSNTWTQFSLFHNYLHSWNQHGGLEALFIDEAQHLSRETLDQLYLLTNLDGQNGKLLQIILAGHPELEHTLASSQLRHLQPRIATHHHLLPLAAEEVGAFIQYRLEVAGSPRLDLFASEAEHAIACYSGGIPRLINVICDAALGTAARAGLHTVTTEIILQVAHTLQLQPSFPLQLTHKSISKELPLMPIGFKSEPQISAQATSPLIAGETTLDSAVAPQSTLQGSTRTQRRFLSIHHWCQQAVGLSLSVILAWLSAQLLLFHIGQIETSPQPTLQTERLFSSVQTPIREPAARADEVAPGNERTMTPLEASQTVSPAPRVPGRTSVSCSETSSTSFRKSATAKSKIFTVFFARSFLFPVPTHTTTPGTAAAKVTNGHRFSLPQACPRCLRQPASTLSTLGCAFWRREISSLLFSTASVQSLIATFFFCRSWSSGSGPTWDAGCAPDTRSTLVFKKNGSTRTLSLVGIYRESRNTAQSSRHRLCEHSRPHPKGWSFSE